MMKYAALFAVIATASAAAPLVDVLVCTESF